MKARKLAKTGPHSGRRRFIGNAAAVIAGAGLGVLDEALGEPLAPAPAARFVGLVPFRGEGSPPLGRPFGSGLAGRRVLDLERLEASVPITPNDAFFIRTRRPRRLDPYGPWAISLERVRRPSATLPLEALRAASRAAGVHVLECAGNGPRRRFGLISAAHWSGVPMAEVLERFGPASRDARVLVAGFDEHTDLDAGSIPGASWIFAPDELVAGGAFLATAMNGEPLPPDHGHPVRLIVPGWYGCACIKWVNRIAWVSGDAAPTGQMREYAGRTHQEGLPARAADYRAALVDVAALPVRVEHWRVAGRPLYRVRGIAWGGAQAPAGLEIRFARGEAYRPVADYTPYDAGGWSVWSTSWRPGRPGHHRIRLRVPDARVRTRRLDAGYYARAVIVTDV